MRTHLLRTFYPPAAIEPDTGCAANDQDGGDAAPTPLAPPKPSLHVAHVATASANDGDDDYVLGGYAGI